jgi:hypothetical protein
MNFMLAPSVHRLNTKQILSYAAEQALSAAHAASQDPQAHIEGNISAHITAP